ncbi:MAG: ribonuclease HI family protein [Minisyncoccia bacterium]
MNLFNDNEKIVIYTDGGARGNPGPAAIGVIIGNKKYSKYLGIKTNNEAEYEAIIFALKKAKQLIGKLKAKKTEIEIKMDSELVCKQLNAQYKIKEPHLFPLFIEIWNLKMDFKKVFFNYIPREKNFEADKLVNQELNNLKK